MTYTYTYTITIAIDAQGIQAITSSGQYVALSKLVTGVGNSPTVLWLAFSPLGQNTVTWTDACGIYVTTTPLKPANTLLVNAQTDGAALPDLLYSFARGQFTAGTQTGAGYGVADQTPDPHGAVYSFGLLQNATVNDTAASAPTNALSMLYGEEAWFVQQQTVSLYLAYACPNGTVISGIPPTALTITLSAAQPSASVAYNDANNTFFLV